MSCDFCRKADFGNFSAKVDNVSAGIYLAGGNYRFPSQEQFAFCPVCGELRKKEISHDDMTATDFLGKPLCVGARVVGMVYSRTSSSLRRGVVTKLTPKTATIKTEYGERRFDHEKLIKIYADTYVPEDSWFDSIGEYELFLDKLYAFIEEKMEVCQDDLKYLSSISNVICENCGEKVSTSNFEYVKTFFREIAYRECLALFSLAKKKIQRELKINGGSE